MKWKEGRQGTGYKVLTLFKSERFKCDCHIIKYDVGAYIPQHTDPAPDGYVHKRINFVWRSLDCVGGRFFSYGATILPIFKCGLLGVFLFEPSELPHWVEKIERGKRWVFSLGWLKRKQEVGLNGSESPGKPSGTCSCGSDSGDHAELGLKETTAARQRRKGEAIDES